MKVVKKVFVFPRGKSGEVEVIKNSTLKTWRCTQVYCYPSEISPDLLKTMLKIGEKEVYPYDGYLNVDYGVTPFPADFELKPHSKLKLWYDNASSSDQIMLLVLVFEEEE